LACAGSFLEEPIILPGEGSEMSAADTSLLIDQFHMLYYSAAEAGLGAIGYTHAGSNGKKF